MSRRQRYALMVLAPVLFAGASALWHGHWHGGHEHEATHARDGQDHGHAAHAQERGGHPEGAPHGHEGGEGLSLQPAITESVTTNGQAGCARGLTERRYDVDAIAVPITLNRYGDHDPEGLLYALADDVERVRAEAAQAAEGVSVGLQGDAIQPLVLRVNPGECLVVHLTNRLEEPASFHLHGSSLVVAGGGGSATMDNPAAMAEPGESVTYEWAVADEEPEGTHLFHSHGDARAQSDHGLFGTLVVEPAGSTWHDPRTGAADTTGWDAVVRPAEGAPFREFVIAYHEIGHEDYRISRAGGGKVPVVDPLTGAYRPAARAINYRSEPFGNRLELQRETLDVVDESLAYSSYAFGDPATPVLRSYVGEPVKQRVVHGGGEVFHVHHVHGGSVRWRRQPGAGVTGGDSGLTKRPPLEPGPSERTDSQSLGPSESFDVDHECGSGGCQQGAGDYLVHCHVAHHYFAGMWGIWRVYNTAQDGPSSTDALPSFDPLDDTDVEAAVDSTDLTADQRDAARRLLPPAGPRQEGEASVWDWREEDGLLVGEPETQAVWPGYASPTPGQRPPILFEPNTGMPAYPLLRPHLGVRPPFAPDHGPAPQLDPSGPDGDPPEPGANGPTSLCPTGTRRRPLSLRAIKVGVPLNQRQGLTDPAGMLFVLSEDEERVRGDPSARTPLVVRANAGEECLDVVLTSALPDTRDLPLSKVSAHIHFVQFDVQAGDGVTTGFNYEQTIRPFTVEGASLAEVAAPGDTQLRLADAGRFPVGASIGVGMGAAQGPEIVRVVAVAGDGLFIDRPLRRAHAAGDVVSTEFVRYRWYPDAQVGTAYFHDHVNGLVTWQHGLVGALVIEPPGATYHDPRTGRPVTSGPVADVRLDDDTAVSADVSGSFRELVSFVQDGSRLSNVGRSAGSNLNLRAQPLAGRDGPPERAFSSTLHGDPETPIVEANVGDPVVVRATVGGTNEVHTLHVDGHWFRREPWSTDSLPTSTARLGISERMDLFIPAAGGPQRRAGDYLYANGRALKVAEGAWGLLRVHDHGSSELMALPGRDAAPDAGPICPPTAPRRDFSVAAVEARLPMLGAVRGRVFVVESDADAVEQGEVPAEPLVLRAGVGDCVTITLHNRLPAGAPPVSVHADGLAYDPGESGGIEVGREPAQTVATGQRRTYTYFAHPEYGESVAMLRDGGDLARSGARGLYGAVVIGPPGVEYEPPVGWSADATAPDGGSWRDVALFLHDEDDAIGTHRMPYTVNVRGAVGVNYGRGDSAPVIEAYAGDPLRLSVLAPYSEQVQVFSFEGHRWPLEPRMAGSTRVESLAIGGLEAITVIPEGGAGGTARLPGTYQVGNHREPYREAGQWARLVVHEPCTGDVEGLARLPAGARCRGDGQQRALLLVLAAALVGAGTLMHRRRLPGAPLAPVAPTR